MRDAGVEPLPERRGAHVKLPASTKFRELPDYAAKRAALEKASAYERRDIFPATYSQRKLVTGPGQDLYRCQLGVGLQ
jgi:hypothetical protein